VPQQFYGLADFIDDTGVISATLVSIKTALSHRELTTLDKSLVTSCTSLFALIASPLTGILADRFGRKNIILVADGLFILGALWQAFTSSVWGMIFGRSIVGLAVGAASFVAPLYISECAPSQFRGRLVTVSTLFITGGQVVSYVIGYFFSLHTQGWRWMVGLGALPAAIQIVVLLLLGESPRWLVRMNRKDEAKRILGKIYGTGQAKAIEKVLRDVEKEVMEEEEATRLRASRVGAQKVTWYTQAKGGWTELFAVGGHRRALTIACLLQGLQQLCGFVSSTSLYSVHTHLCSRH
jgi:MFS transporter, SP family, solute carrier family 2 (myo-inositol transporter), member 13